VRRTFPIRQGFRLLPDSIVDQTLTFGKIFSAKDPRQIQFVLRASF
jgi:hypothetical protein